MKNQKQYTVKTTDKGKVEQLNDGNLWRVLSVRKMQKFIRNFVTYHHFEVISQIP